MINTNPNTDSCTLETLCTIIENYNLVGDVLEFGTCTCQSSIQLATSLPEKTIFTIDHFQQGSFALGAWNAGGEEFPRTIEEAKQKLSIRPNITLVLSDIHKLTEPADYNIGKIAICNVDVDIYEPTVSSLEFLSKCEWSEVFIRFDDWHGGEPDYDQHERLAFTEWIEKYNYKFDITHGGNIGGVYVKR